jgi:hypothetical protein
LILNEIITFHLLKTGNYPFTGKEPGCILQGYAENWLNYRKRPLRLYIPQACQLPLNAIAPIDPGKIRFDHKKPAKPMFFHTIWLDSI